MYVTVERKKRLFQKAITLLNSGGAPWFTFQLAEVRLFSEGSRDAKAPARGLSPQASGPGF